MSRLTALLLVLLFSPGCFIVRGRVDHPIDENHIAAIQRGVTTKKQILQMFGPPQVIDAREIVALSDYLGVPSDNPQAERLVAARYFRYEYDRGNGAALITLVFNYVDADVKRDTLVVFFDSKDVVEDYAFAKDTEQLPALGPLDR